MLTPKGGRYDDAIPIQQQLHFKTQDFSECFQQWRERWALLNDVGRGQHGTASNRRLS
jgi:hypothetical protein